MNFFTKNTQLRLSNFVVLLFILLNCSGGQQLPPEQSYTARSLNEFSLLDWQRKVEVFVQWPSNAPLDESGRQLLKLGLEDEHPSVIIACLQRVAALNYDENHNYLVTLLNHPDPMVRWNALLALEQVPVLDKDLATVIKCITDTEWLVREAAFRSIRRYSFEKDEKNFFFSIIFSLEEQNAAVLVEIYRTLIWYEDERAFTYMLKRTYLTRSGVELIAILRELNTLQRPEVTARIRSVARSNSQADIRKAAIDLLKNK